MVCLKPFRTTGGLAWHVEHDPICHTGYEAVGQLPRHPRQDEWDTWAHKGIKAPVATRHTLGHSVRDNIKRAEMRTMRLQGRTA